MLSPTLNLADVLPETGWIRRYVAAAMKLTDAPPVYHVLAAIGILSGAACNKAEAIIHVGDDTREEPLHMWTMAVGPSGNHKGYSVRLAYWMAKTVLGTRYRAPTGSRQGIEDMIEEEHAPIFLMDEAPEFFAVNHAAVRGASAFWCNLYDGVYRPRHLAGNFGGKEQRIDVAFLAAGATEGLLEYTKPIDWRGGLLSRMFLLSEGYSDQPKPIGFSWPPEVAMSLADEMQRCVAAARPGKTKNDRATVGAERHAVEMYISWSNELTKQLRGLRGTRLRLGVRLGNHVLRTAALFALSRRCDTISASDMLAATRLGRHGLDTISRLPIP